MIFRILLISFLISLTGCDTFVRKEVITEHHYVVRKAAEQQKAIPPFVTPINVEKANQLDLATWITQNESRQLRLESIITELVNFYEGEISEEEKKLISPAQK